jgi:shikimate dehydrogenase
MFGLIGKPLVHSYSQWIHEKLTNQPYQLWEVDDLATFFANETFIGCNVTHPFKKSVMAYCDELDDIAMRCQNVNTVIKRDGVVRGYNTDYYGLSFLLDYFDIHVATKHVVIVGSGGAAQTTKVLMEDLGARVTMLSRKPKENVLPYSSFGSLEAVDIVIHATPVGTSPNEASKPVIDISLQPQTEWVIDLIYNPRRTNLMIEAELLGINAVSGLMMLLAQALKAAELFHQTTYPESWIVQTALQQMKSSTNIVFIGMPLSGKSTVARLVAQYLNKGLADIDQLIEEQIEKSIPEIFAKEGETAFRSYETQMVDMVAKERGLVVATGGGVVMNEANIRALKRHGVLVYLDVDISLLMTQPVTGRPLLQEEGALLQLYELRYPRYMHYADIILKRESFEEEAVIFTLKEALDAYFASTRSKS